MKAANREGMTPLAMAALYGNPAMIDRLLKAGADAKQLGPNGETMVMFAARNGNPQAVKLLLEAGADVNARGTAPRDDGADVGRRAEASRGREGAARCGRGSRREVWRRGAAAQLHGDRVEQRAVAPARRIAVDARLPLESTYEEQLDVDQKSGVEIGGQRGLGQALDPMAIRCQRRRPSGRSRRTARRNGDSGTEAAPAAAAPAAAARCGVRRRSRPRQARSRRRGSQQPAAQQRQADNDDDNEVVFAGLVGSGGGGLTPLIFAAREGDIESARLLLDAGAQRQPDDRVRLDAAAHRGQQPQLPARAFLLDRGADPNLANKGGWTPLYSRPTTATSRAATTRCRSRDMDHLEIIKKLLEKGANPNAPVKENTLTRTIFTMQWFFEDGATPFIRAAQSSDTVLMKLLLEYKARPEGDDGERRQRADRERRHRLGGGRDLRAIGERERRGDEDAARPRTRSRTTRNNEGRTALMGAAHEGPHRRDAAARRPRRQAGRRTTTAAATPTRWRRLPRATRGRRSTTPRGSCASACSPPSSRPETAALIRKLMAERDIPAPPAERTILSVCVVALCPGDEPVKSDPHQLTISNFQLPKDSLGIGGLGIGSPALPTQFQSFSTDTDARARTLRR